MNEWLLIAWTYRIARYVPLWDRHALCKWHSSSRCCSLTICGLPKSWCDQQLVVDSNPSLGYVKSESSKVRTFAYRYDLWERTTNSWHDGWLLVVCSKLQDSKVCTTTLKVYAVQVDYVDLAASHLLFIVVMRRSAATRYTSVWAGQGLLRSTRGMIVRRICLR